MNRILVKMPEEGACETPGKRVADSDSGPSKHYTLLRSMQQIPCDALTLNVEGTGVLGPHPAFLGKVYTRESGRRRASAAWMPLTSTGL